MNQKIITVTVKTRRTECQTVGKAGQKRRGKGRSAGRWLGYAALAVLGLLLFRAGADYAAEARGYRALGGEVFALLLPALGYLGARTVLDWAGTLRKWMKGG